MYKLDPPASLFYYLIENKGQTIYNLKHDN
jgi:hypothetical protein